MFVPCAGKICIKLFIIIFCLNKNNKCFYKCKYVIIIKFLILFFQLVLHIHYTSELDFMLQNHKTWQRNLPGKYSATNKLSKLQ